MLFKISSLKMLRSWFLLVSLNQCESSMVGLGGDGGCCSFLNEYFHTYGNWKSLKDWAKPGSRGFNAPKVTLSTGGTLPSLTDVLAQAVIVDQIHEAVAQNDNPRIYEDITAETVMINTSGRQLQVKLRESWREQFLWNLRKVVQWLGLDQWLDLSEELPKASEESVRRDMNAVGLLAVQLYYDDFDLKGGAATNKVQNSLKELRLNENLNKSSIDTDAPPNEYHNRALHVWLTMIKEELLDLDSNDATSSATKERSITICIGSPDGNDNERGCIKLKTLPEFFDKFERIFASELTYEKCYKELGGLKRTEDSVNSM